MPWSFIRIMLKRNTHLKIILRTLKLLLFPWVCQLLFQTFRLSLKRLAQQSTDQTRRAYCQA